MMKGPLPPWWSLCGSGSFFHSIPLSLSPPLRTLKSHHIFISTCPSSFGGCHVASEAFSPYTAEQTYSQLITLLSVASLFWGGNFSFSVLNKFISSHRGKKKKKKIFTFFVLLEGDDTKEDFILVTKFEKFKIHTGRKVKRLSERAS